MVIGAGAVVGSCVVVGSGVEVGSGTSSIYFGGSLSHGTPVEVETLHIYFLNILCLYVC